MNGKTTWILGADRDCDIVVDYPSVSRRHCRLTRKPDGSFTLEDLGSTNGTFVNGGQIRAETPVRRNDAITLGLTVAMPWPELPAIVEPQAGPKVVRVGREPDNDLVLDRPEVSGHHARIVIANGAQTGFVEDLGSTNGTSVNALTPRVSRAEITPADVVYFGPVAVNVAKFFSIVPVVNREVVPELLFQGATMIVGRDPSCDRVLENSVVSSRHAQIVRDGRAFRIEDLGSSNGTFINGRRVGRSATVRPGDLIGFGQHEVRLVDGSPELAGPPKVNWSLVALLVALFIQVFVWLALILVSFGTSAPGAWLGMALSVFWIGLTWGLFERLVMAKLDRAVDPDRASRAILAQSLIRVPFLDLFACLLVFTAAFARMKLSVEPASIGILWLTALIGSALGDALARLTGQWLTSLAAAAWLLMIMGMLSSPAWSFPTLGVVGRVAAESMPTRWAFEGLLDLSAGEAAMDPANDPVERYFPIETDRTGPLACAMALLSMLGALMAFDAIIARSALDRSYRAGPESH